MQPERNVGAIILAGGQSRRMGQPKALMRLTPDGPRLIELVLQVVTPLTQHIVISTNTPAIYDWLPYPLVADTVADSGPMVGLEAGLTAIQSTFSINISLLLGCDMPFVATDLLRYLIAQMRTDDDAVVPLNQSGQPEPLCAIYRQSCLPIIRAQLASRMLKMSAWLSLVHTRFIPAAALRPFDPRLRSFQNLNTPADLQMAL